MDRQVEECRRSYHEKQEQYDNEQSKHVELLKEKIQTEREAREKLRPPSQATSVGSSITIFPPEAQLSEESGSPPEGQLSDSPPEAQLSEKSGSPPEGQLSDSPPSEESGSPPEDEGTTSSGGVEIEAEHNENNPLVNDENT